MRLRNITGSREIIAGNDYVVHEPEKHKGSWKKDVFNNENPVHIEIGMGKGRFLMELAERNPGINYVGIEKYSSVLLRAIQKMEANELKNLVFVRMDAEYITDVFESGEVAKIYLNFSDPWPKDRHAKRRLTSRQFLERYDQFLDPDGTVEFKTDNRGLFDFSLEEIEESKWSLLMSTYDLHSDSELCEGNVMTEYEEKFVAEGIPINKLVIKR